MMLPKLQTLLLQSTAPSLVSLEGYVAAIHNIFGIYGVIAIPVLVLGFKVLSPEVIKAFSDKIIQLTGKEKVNIKANPIYYGKDFVIRDLEELITDDPIARSIFISLTESIVDTIYSIATRVYKDNGTDYGTELKSSLEVLKRAFKDKLESKYGVTKGAEIYIKVMSDVEPILAEAISYGTATLSLIKLGSLAKSSEVYSVHSILYVIVKKASVSSVKPIRNLSLQITTLINQL